MFLKKKFFMLNKLYKDLTRGKDFYSIAEDVHSQELGNYYFVFDESRVRAGKDQALITDFDENGIPLNKPYVDVDSDKLIYFPISIGQMGLSVFHTCLLTKKEKDIQRFIKFADWYVENVELSDTLGARWLTKIPLPQYHNPGPWQSAFSQSRAISILLRAFQLTGNDRYEEIAEKALIPFMISVKDGGVMSETDWGPFFEEYTAEVPVLVFNGHIFSLFGINDFKRVFPKHELSNSLFVDGYNSLINCLETYDLGYWTRYNYCQTGFYPKTDTATLSYQRLHIMLLQAINKISRHAEIEETIIRWNQYITFRNCIRAYKNKYTELKYLGRL
tara:strand:+ start:2669 stop:3664 length:996 start_codon:yes stop_codon:yes gene_type:complete